MPSVAPQQPNPQASQPAQKAPQSANVQFTIVIPTPPPASARRPAYVSSSTKSASIAVGSASAVTVNCTATCSATVDAPVGSDTFSVKLYDGTNGAGNLLSTGSLTQTIVTGQANNVNVTFNGVVASLQMSAFPTVTPGSAGSVAVAVNALDADGNTIIGPGNYVDASGNPVTIALANSDTSSNSSFSQTTLTAPPATPVTLNYTAGFDANPTITASATGFTSVHAQVTFPAPTLTALSTWSGTISQGTVSETLTGTNFVAGSTTLNAGAGLVITAVNVTSSTSLTATFDLVGASFGTQFVSATTTSGTSSSVPFALASGPSFTVNDFADANAGTPAGTGAGISTGATSGDLRWVLQNAPTGSQIVFSGCSTSTPCVIALNGPLPQMSGNLIIDGGSYGSVIINGQNQYRAFWAESGTIVLENLEIQNAAAIGGASNNAAGGGGGGGGAGLGGGLFIDSPGAIVSLINDYFYNDSVVGGSGGSSIGGGILGGSGGGGLIGAGGYGIGGGGGGGGLLGPGSATASNPGANGGVGYVSCAGGSAGGVAGSGAAGSAGEGGSAAGCGGGGGGAGANGSTSITGYSGGIGGAAGFGAGGGGGALGGAAGPTLGDGGNGGQGGNGGFAGGGGAGGAGGAGGTQAGYGGNGGNGGDGGAGGGGGGGGKAGANTSGDGQLASAGFGGFGGTLSSNVHGGNGGGSGALGGGAEGGGGGAAVGPAVFLNAGTLITFNSDASACNATAGMGGSSGGSDGGADPTPVFNYGGTVNGVTVTAGSGGPVASALGTSMP